MNLNSIEFDNISWYGTGEIAPSIRDPRKLYDRLFSKDSFRAHVADVSDLVLADARSPCEHVYAHVAPTSHELDACLEMGDVDSDLESDCSDELPCYVILIFVRFPISLLLLYR